MVTAFTTRPELRGTFGMVASTHWLASGAGMAVLERGGNAFDAAVAAGFTLQVVEPHLNGPGGDLPAVFWSAERGEPVVLCAQGFRRPRRRSSASASSATSSFRARGFSPPAFPGRSTAGCCFSASSARGGSRTCSSSRSATRSTGIRSSRASPRRSNGSSPSCASGPLRPSCTFRRRSPERSSATASSPPRINGFATRRAAARVRTRSSARASFLHGLRRGRDRPLQR